MALFLKSSRAFIVLMKALALQPRVIGNSMVTVGMLPIPLGRLITDRESFSVPSLAEIGTELYDSDSAMRQNLRDAEDIAHRWQMVERANIRDEVVRSLEMYSKISSGQPLNLASCSSVRS